MKKIIYVLPRKPFPPYAGQSKLAFSRAKALKNLGYDTELIFICRNSQKVIKKDEKNLKKVFKKITPINLNIIDWLMICFSCIPKTIFLKIPLRCQLVNSPKVIKDFKKIINKDQNDSILHFYSASTYPFWREAELKKKYFVIDMVDSSTLNIKRKLKLSKNLIKKLFWKLEYKLTKSFETNLPNYEFCKKYLCVSKVDLNFFKIRKSPKIQNSFSSSSVGIEINKVIDRGHNFKFNLIFFGSLWYEPNINALNWLIEKVLKKVWLKDKRIKLLIAGSNPPYKLINKCKKYKNITLIKNPINMSKLIISSKISVAPMISGSGQQNKIIESISLGVPVITTSIAAEALELKYDEHLLVADKPEDFANKILNLNNNYELYEAISKKGLEFVNEKYNWENLVKELLAKIYI